MSQHEIPFLYKNNPVVPNFVFKIRLLRLGFSFQKTKIPVFEPQPIYSQAIVITNVPKSQLWEGDKEKL